MSDRFQDIRILEAMLFASAEPLGTAELAKRLPEIENLDPLLEELATLYANRGVNLVRIGQQWAFRTAPDLGTRMTMEKEVPRKLSRAAVETLAIVAYHQPVTRAEIEEIRGVALSRGTLDTLLEAGWIRPKGRRRTPGKPVTWATTEGFLDHFGLESLEALPGHEELKAAGLLDTRPAITALGERGLLADLDRDDDEEEEEEDELDEQEATEVLRAEFGGAAGQNRAARAAPDDPVEDVNEEALSSDEAAAESASDGDSAEAGVLEVEQAEDEQAEDGAAEDGAAEDETVEDAPSETEADSAEVSGDGSEDPAAAAVRPLKAGG